MSFGRGNNGVKISKSIKPIIKQNATVKIIESKNPKVKMKEKF